MVISPGQHDSPIQGMNLLEYASTLAGGPFTDYPAGVSPVLAAFLRDVCDDCRDEFRQRLPGLGPQLLGTHDPRILREDARAWIVSDFLVRAQCFSWAKLLQQTPDVARFRELKETTWSNHETALSAVLQWQENLAASGRLDSWVDDGFAKGEPAEQAQRIDSGRVTDVSKRALLWASINYSISCEVVPLDARVAHARLGEQAFAACLEAIRLARRRGLDTTATVVSLEEAALRLCHKALAL